MYTIYMKLIIKILLFFILTNSLLSKEFSLESYSNTQRFKIKVSENFFYENIRINGQWKDSEGQYGLSTCQGNIVTENKIKKLRVFCEYTDRDNDKAWTTMSSRKQLDNESQMYQFDTTGDVGQNIYLNGSGKYKKYIGYKCTYAVKYYDDKYNFLVQKCKPPK